MTRWVAPPRLTGEKCGLRLGPLQARSVAPEHFELVEVARGGAEDVDDDVDVVDEDPAAAGVALSA